jgi:uncharacterized protein (DUF1778 family)
MSKTHKLDVRLSADELQEIERAARLFNMPKSQYARLMLIGAAAQNPQPAQQPQPPQIDETRIERIEAQIAEMRESLIASARAFDELLVIFERTAAHPVVSRISRAVRS